MHAADTGDKYGTPCSRGNHLNISSENVLNIRIQYFSILKSWVFFKLPKFPGYKAFRQGRAVRLRSRSALRGQGTQTHAVPLLFAFSSPTPQSRSSFINEPQNAQEGRKVSMMKINLKFHGH